MAELSRICRAARHSAAHEEPLWLATVMRVKGSAYRRPGARMLFSSGQVLAGSVSGGCLEASLVRKGPWLTRERPVCVRLAGSLDQEDDEKSPRGTGCQGIVDILLERASFEPSCAPLAVIEDCLKSERRAVIASVFESSDAFAPVGARLTLDEARQFNSYALSGPSWATLARAAEQVLAEQQTAPRRVCSDRFEALLEVIEPPPHLFVFGAGPDVLPLVEFATALGFGVTVCDTSARIAVRERFAASAELHVGSVASVAPLIAARRTPVAVVMSHDYSTDRQALQLLLDSRARYIGMLGPLGRSQRMLSELFLEPALLAKRDPTRVRAPLGLDLGGETPAHIALSAIAEIQAVLAGTSACPLSQRGMEPIHAAHVAGCARLGQDRHGVKARVACAVLAAGASRRLGHPKQLSLHRGQPLVHLAADCACQSQAMSAAVIVGAHAGSVRAALAALPIEVVPNPDWEQGMAGSIRVAATWAEQRSADALLLALCDQPRLSAAHLDRLIAEFSRTGLPVASYYAHKSAVPALFPRSLFAALAGLDGDSGASRLLNDGRALSRVSWADGEFDVDTLQAEQELSP